VQLADRLRCLSRGHRTADVTNGRFDWHVCVQCGASTFEASLFAYLPKLPIRPRSPMTLPAAWCAKAMSSAD
jgi:hypothetical protein